MKKKVTIECLFHSFSVFVFDDRDPAVNISQALQFNYRTCSLLIESSLRTLEARPEAPVEGSEE